MLFKGFLVLMMMGFCVSFWGPRTLFSGKEESKNLDCYRSVIPAEDCHSRERLSFPRKRESRSAKLKAPSLFISKNGKNFYKIELTRMFKI